MIEAKYLPDADKRAFARQLLAGLGATNVTERGDELNHSCILPFGLHANGDRSASASFNWRKLAYNCFLCGGGGLLWLVGTCNGTSGTDAERWVKKEFKLDFSNPDDFMRVIDGILHEEKSRPPIMPRYPDSFITSWLNIHPYMTEIRQVPVDTLMRFQVGWDPEDNRVVIPHRWQGTICGWQKRRLVEGLDKRGFPIPKYQNSPEFPRDRTLFNHDPTRARVVVVESPMSVLRHWHHAPYMVATFGAELTETQLGWLARHGHVTLWFDPDPAGWNATKLAIEYLSKRTDVAVVVSPWNADPADMDDATVDALIADAVIWPLWSPPDPRSILEWGQ